VVVAGVYGSVRTFWVDSAAYEATDNTK
jgi:hypothetical protein